MAPSWLWVPLMFHILMGFWMGIQEICSLLSNCWQMKLLVAPELANTSHSAVACADLNRTGICIDWYLLLYTLIFNALAPAAGLRCEENPPSCQTWCLQIDYGPHCFCCKVAWGIFPLSGLLKVLNLWDLNNPMGKWPNVETWPKGEMAQRGKCGSILEND